MPRSQRRRFMHCNIFGVSSFACCRCRKFRVVVLTGIARVNDSYAKVSADLSTTLSSSVRSASRRVHFSFPAHSESPGLFWLSLQAVPFDARNLGRDRATCSDLS
jgi:hypothetical protein